MLAIMDAVLHSLVLDPRLVLRKQNRVRNLGFLWSFVCLSCAFTGLLCCACRTLKPPWTQPWTSCGSWSGRAASSTRPTLSWTPWSRWKRRQWWPPPRSPPAPCTRSSSRTLSPHSSAVPARLGTSPAPSGRSSPSRWPRRWSPRPHGPNLQCSPKPVPPALVWPPLHLSSLLTSPVLSDPPRASLWMPLLLFQMERLCQRH